MYRFLLSRAIGLVFVLFGVSLLTFLCGYFAPGDPIRTVMGMHFDPVTYAQLRHQYGLDLPPLQQYYNFIVNALHGNFGGSFEYPGLSAWDLLKQGLPYSIELGLDVLIVQVLLGVPTGVIAALRSNTHADTFVTSLAILCVSLPDIVIIVLFQVAMVWLYKNHLPSLPIAGWNTPSARIAPVLITATTGFGYFTRLTRTSILEILGQDYVRTARAKGMRERAIINRHVLRNAILPLITVLGPSLAFVVTGVFITEQFFNIPGMSAITLSSISQRDYPVIQATTILISIVVVVFNALTDIAYALVDPRIKIE